MKDPVVGQPLAPEEIRVVSQLFEQPDFEVTHRFGRKQNLLNLVPPDAGREFLI